MVGVFVNCMRLRSGTACYGRREGRRGESLEAFVGGRISALESARRRHSRDSARLAASIAPAGTIVLYHAPHRAVGRRRRDVSSAYPTCPGGLLRDAARLGAQCALYCTVLYRIGLHARWTHAQKQAGSRMIIVARHPSARARRSLSELMHACARARVRIILHRVTVLCGTTAAAAARRGCVHPNRHRWRRARRVDGKRVASLCPALSCSVRAHPGCPER
ncbi:hypothetical protein FKP32DRAFT_856548 [Trametes sanguinea]|nr:hypothetical protein FKP32DRAFT_856548 [Trametes sanguinea]